MSEPESSYIEGDFSVTQREDNTGGNLSVDGNISFTGDLIGNLPNATAGTTGAVKVALGSGLEVSAQGALSWKPLYRYRYGNTTMAGTGTYICVNSNTIEIDQSGTETALNVRIKSGGGLGIDGSGNGLILDVNGTKTLLGLEAAAYKTIAVNTGDSDDAGKIPILGGGGKLAYAVIPSDFVRESGLETTLQSYVTATALGTTLSAYVTSSALSTTLGGYVTATSLTTTLNGYVQTTALSAYVTNTALNTTLQSYVTATALNNTLSAYVTSSSLSSTLASYATSASVTSEIYSALLDYALEDHQHTVTPVYDVPVSGLITLERDKASYVKTITGNTVVGFDTTGLGLGANDSATFELLLKMETYVYPVLFGNNIAWLNGEEPYFNDPNKSYLFAFRTYDGGNSWVGAYQGAF